MRLIAPHFIHELWRRPRDNLFLRILFMSLEDKRTNLFQLILFMSYDVVPEIIYSSAR